MLITSKPIGEHLRDWRQRRRRSQLDLALDADISARHLSFLETGRWPEALHRQYPKVGGLVWMSRQRDRDQSLMLFGDRA